MVAISQPVQHGLQNGIHSLWLLLLLYIAIVNVGFDVLLQVRLDKTHSALYLHRNLDHRPTSVSGREAAIFFIAPPHVPLVGITGACATPGMASLSRRGGQQRRDVVLLDVLVLYLAHLWHFHRDWYGLQ